ncbi:hypothetical protein HAV15_002093 [Penicillium sp. str. |nr:hypothetical protein HAV15_002093 [Penicillium sp. str. \
MTTPIVFFLPVLFTLLIVHSAPVEAQNIQRESKSAAPPTVDKPLLAIQIGSIVGAYVIFVALLLALLIFVGRRLHRLPAWIPAQSLLYRTTSPVQSPVDLSRGGSLNRSARPSQPSMNGSMVTIDESIVANDRQRAQHDMEMLYAAVMEHDAQKASGVDLSVREQDLQAQSPDSQLTNPFTDRASHVSDNSLAPLAPLKSPTKGFNSSRLSKLFNSGSRANPDPSKVRSPRLAIRKMPISSPLASPAVATPQAYIHENPPLSPRIYNPGPPPVVPRLQASEAIRPAPGRARPPAPLTLNTPSPSSSIPSNLPFREAYPPQSAPATKTTILERPVKNRAGPLTGMATPYSPYMPFTPVTPYPRAHGDKATAEAGGAWEWTASIERR